MTRQERIARLKAISKQRILILDGSWGVMFQKRGLDEADYRGDRFADHKGQLKGNNDILCLTRPDIVADLHDAYYAAGADISETNTFSATTIAQADYELESRGPRHQPGRAPASPANGRRRAGRPRSRTSRASWPARSAR